MSGHSSVIRVADIAPDLKVEAAQAAEAVRADSPAGQNTVEAPCTRLVHKTRGPGAAQITSPAVFDTVRIVFMGSEERAFSHVRRSLPRVLTRRYSQFTENADLTIKVEFDACKNSTGASDDDKLGRQTHSTVAESFRIDDRQEVIDTFVELSAHFTGLEPRSTENHDLMKVNLRAEGDKRPNLVIAGKVNNVCDDAGDYGSERVGRGSRYVAADQSIRPVERFGSETEVCGQRPAWDEGHEGSAQAGRFITVSQRISKTRRFSNEPEGQCDDKQLVSAVN
ncbi:hypothetical protein DFH09DRAFT_1067896 [Mycena vulgaris]|nr:hypothetical protein DFH09DRAFT_1067896 [Mycena vulgaris]